MLAIVAESAANVARVLCMTGRQAGLSSTHRSATASDWRCSVAHLSAHAASVYTRTEMSRIFRGPTRIRIADVMAIEAHYLLYTMPTANF